MDFHLQKGMQCRRMYLFIRNKTAKLYLPSIKLEAGIRDKSLGESSWRATTITLLLAQHSSLVSDCGEKQNNGPVCNLNEGGFTIGREDKSMEKYSIMKHLHKWPH
jgi:hypothetical protein